MVKPTNKALLALLIALGISSAAAAAAQSTAPATNGDNNMHAFQDGQTSAPASPAAQQKVPAPGDRNCLQTTGSLIPAKPGHCLTVPGRSYSREDIQNTGEPTLGPALQKLDPSVTVRGGH